MFNKGVDGVGALYISDAPAQSESGAGSDRCHRWFRPARKGTYPYYVVHSGERIFKIPRLVAGRGRGGFTRGFTRVVMAKWRWTVAAARATARYFQPPAPPAQRPQFIDFARHAAPPAPAR
ncbi:hypothetical protein EVAR_66526_1 [Eumeta japonica]|uniref:Uncharacterized protein n=1 Tax=Eumeta variegata TaxID=151549 RepID=A0A4C1Z7G7_EUMVA|nr:hypothetical protein EVAR_66526_1 [Eumeta japonica]